MCIHIYIYIEICVRAYKGEIRIFWVYGDVNKGIYGNICVCVYIYMYMYI